jgi:hypothetical protein
MATAVRAAGVLILLFGALIAIPARAWGNGRTHVPVPVLKLTVAPIVDVGTWATFRLTTRSWPRPATASLHFLSSHHGFTGTMRWMETCRCFQPSLPIGKHIHPLERAQAWAMARSDAGIARASTSFLIRGLAPSGRDYSPGGPPFLSAWVGDPRPSRKMLQHFCAWVHASDGFGLRGVSVRFVVRYGPGLEQFTLRTNADGVACSHRSIDSAPAGIRVPVDIYAGHLHAATEFTPRL